MTRRTQGTAAMPQCEISEEPFGRSGRLLEVRGELDVATAPQLRERLAAVVDHGADHVLLDLSGVEFIDSLASAALVHAHQRLEGRLAIVATQPYVLLIFEAGGLDGILNVFGSQEAAEAFLLG